MGKFKTVCGKEFDVPKNNTHATGVLLSRQYPPEMADQSFDVSENCKKCEALKQEFSATYLSRDMGTTFNATNTTCIATNVDFEEKKLVSEYGEPCSNTTEKYVFEIVLQTETARAYIQKEIRSRGATAFDHIKDIAETLWDDYQEQKDPGDDDYIVIQMFDAERADCMDIEIYNVDDLERMIISVRLIEFEQEIDNK